MRRVLVVANETLIAPALIDAIRTQAAATKCAFHLVVPATRLDPPPADENLDGRIVAKERLARAISHLSGLDLWVEGEVGDPSPIVAVSDAVGRHTYHEILVATYPPGRSRWLNMGVTRRIERFFKVPVRHLVVTPVCPGPYVAD
jgi:hypothetical protein